MSGPRERHWRWQITSRWAVGMGAWPGKPLFGLFREWHDGPWFVAHLGPFYLEKAP